MEKRNLFRVTFCTPSRLEYRQPSGHTEKSCPVDDVRAWAMKHSASKYARRMLEDYPAISHAFVWGYDPKGRFECTLIKP
jgi:hypothetical protein